MRSKVSDSQDVETSRLSIHRATEKARTVTVLKGQAPSTGHSVPDDRPKQHAQSETPKASGHLVP